MKGDLSAFPQCAWRYFGEPLGHIRSVLVARIATAHRVAGDSRGVWERGALLPTVVGRGTRTPRV
jgi:hypothetical protein